MGSVDTLLAGMAHVFSWPGILIPMAGTLLAMVSSFVPGLGNASVAVLAMVLTANWDPHSVLLLFGALTGGATFMGSITAILFNVPGSVSSTPALLEGYPLSRLGLTRRAIACAATASAVGSVFGVLILMLMLPIIEPLILQIGPLEMLLIAVLGLLTIVIMPSSSKIKSACMVLLGLLLAMVGADPLHGMLRWNFESPQWSDGLGIIPMMMGIFTISELIGWMRSSSQADMHNPTPIHPDDTIRSGIWAVFQHWGLTLRCSAIGTLIGMVPGIGGTIAGFVAYGHAAQSSQHDSPPMGHGNIKGLIAPEAAVDAKDGGSLLPTLALGLPGSESTVILLAVFAMHGMVPGSSMLTTHLELTYTLIFALLFSNLLTSVVGVAMAPALAKVRAFRIDKIALPCLLISIVSVFMVNGSLMDVYAMLFFGVAGYFWRTHDWPRIPFVIAFVLGGMVEKNLEISRQLVQLDRINSASLLTVCVIFLLSVLWLAWKIRTQNEKWTTVPQVDHNADGVGLKLFVFLLSTAALVTALLDAETYSSYARLMACTTSLLSAFMVWQFFVARRSHQPASWFHDLVCTPEHRSGFFTVVWLIPAIVLLGISQALLMCLVIWTLKKPMPWPRWMVALGMAYLLGTLLQWGLSQWTPINLDDGWLTTRWMAIYTSP